MPELNVSNVATAATQHINYLEIIENGFNNQDTFSKRFRVALNNVANSATPLFKTFTIAVFFTSSAFMLRIIDRILRAPIAYKHIMPHRVTDMIVYGVEQCHIGSKPIADVDVAKQKDQYHDPLLDLDKVCRLYTEKKMNEVFESLASLYRTDFHELRNAWSYKANANLIIGIIYGMLIGVICGMLLAKLSRLR